MNKIIIYRQAENDLNNIASYIKKDGIEIANKVLNDFYKLFQSAAQFPEMGILPKDKNLINRGYRMILSNNYLIFYTVTKEEIQIHRILHGASNYKDIL